MASTSTVIVIREPGGPEVLELRVVDRPRPGQGELLVRVSTSGVNRADLLQRRGGYPAPPGVPSDIPGLEFAGVVVEHGPGATAPEAGSRVMGIVAGGGYAEHVVTPAATVLPVPDGLDLREAGAVPEAFLTAYDAALLQAGLHAGEILLVHAVGSGVGTAALQLARRVGATVVGTSRTPAKLDGARALGLEHGVEATDDWPEQVLALTGGNGVDVILDLVGAAYLEGNQRVAARHCRHVVVGLPGGAEGTIDLRALMSRRASIRGTVLRARSVAEKTELARAFSDAVMPDLTSGAVRPVVDRILPARDVVEAHTLLEENRTFGKVLLDWS